jgi:Vacuolar protein sorting-associated protein 62
MRRRSRTRGAIPAFALLACGAAAGPAYGNDRAGELARRFAPIVRLQAQPEPCGHGEPYQPTDVAALLGDDEVALRGPWDRTNIVKIGPTAEDLAGGLFGYHLDFPGDPLVPGCDYEEWSRRLSAGRQPTAYARVVADSAARSLALQYWFFYAYNDYNNKHEGDWEMIQLVFATADPGEALAQLPARVGYSQHEGGEAARWGAEKLALVGETHPVVYPAAGSHANYFEPALYLGRSASQGVGCDDATGPSRDVVPHVVLVPSDPEAARAAYPWLGYQGHWGEKQSAFYNGPTGPNTKPQWRAPIAWADEAWRDRSYAVVGGSLLGPEATDFFCDAVGAGSDALRSFAWRPAATLLLLLAALGLLVWLASRTQWRASAPLRLARRRAIGQMLVAAFRLYLGNARLFLGIGLVFVPLSLVAGLLQSGVLRLTRLEGLPGSAGELSTLVAGLAVGVGLLFGGIALVLVQAACARAMLALDEGKPPSALGAFRAMLEAAPALLGALALLAIAGAALTLSTLGIPVAVWLGVRASLLAQVVAIEGEPAAHALQRSAALVGGHWGRCAGALILAAGVPVVSGPVAGALLLLLAGDLPFAVVNLVGSAIYAVAMPFAAIATTYLYFDLRVREQLEPRTRGPLPALPAEI